MKRFRLSLKAVEDLTDAFNYLEKQSPRAARAVIDKLFAAMDRIGRTPSLGHMREDLTDRPVKFYSVYSYLIVYDPAPRPIRILHVIYGKRDVAEILRSD